MIGQVFGNYKIAQKLGEGGMGEVYRGVDMMLEREVAIKFLRPELAKERGGHDNITVGIIAIMPEGTAAAEAQDAPTTREVEAL